LRAPLSELTETVAANPPKGEIVLVVGRADSQKIREVDLEADLRDALAEHSVRDAADLVAQAHEIPRRKVYQLALKLARG